MCAACALPARARLEQRRGVLTTDGRPLQSGRARRTRSCCTWRRSCRPNGARSRPLSDAPPRSAWSDTRNCWTRPCVPTGRLRMTPTTPGGCGQVCPSACLLLSRATVRMHAGVRSACVVCARVYARLCAWVHGCVHALGRVGAYVCGHAQVICAGPCMHTLVHIHTRATTFTLVVIRQARLTPIPRPSLHARTPWTWTRTRRRCCRRPALV